MGKATNMGLLIGSTETDKTFSISAERIYRPIPIYRPITDTETYRFAP